MQINKDLVEVNIVEEGIMGSDIFQKKFKCFKEKARRQSGTGWIEKKKKEHGNRIKKPESRKKGEGREVLLLRCPKLSW